LNSRGGLLAARSQLNGKAEAVDGLVDFSIILGSDLMIYG
jgi:hypothetical protein